jgi:stalled ribosome rescue protein Dom34
MIGRKKVRKALRQAAAELLMVANELATRPRGLVLSSEEARELANRIRRAAGEVAVVAYEIDREEEEE